MIAEKNYKVTSWIQKSNAVAKKKADLTMVEDMEWMDIEIGDAGLDWNDDEDTEKLFRTVIVNEKREKWMNWKWMKKLVVEVAESARMKSEDKVADDMLNEIQIEIVWRCMAGEVTRIFLMDGRMKEEVLSRVAEAERHRSMQEKASKLESDIKDLEMMILEWKPLGKAQDEDSILTWIMQEYENLDIVMKEAEDRGRQINTKDMRNDITRCWRMMVVMVM